MKLENFLPYKLSVLSNKVSLGIAKFYRDQHDITVPEWRVLALLSDTGNQTAKELTQKGQMDKVKISRTVKLLESKAMITKKPCSNDARAKRYQLTNKGKSLIQQVKPKAQAFEKQLINSIPKEQLDQFHNTITLLYQQAEKIITEMD